MKVLALNSSPRGKDQSKTELMLDHLAAGLREAGADVEIVHLRQKNVRNCIGCYTCWTKTPGICLHQDDMTRELYPKWLAADLVVYASPLYHFTVNATLKAFIERTLPILLPFFEEHKGRTHHPLRHGMPAVVMLSVAGFPDDEVFEQLSSWANYVFRTSLAAEIYRAGAEFLTAPFFAKKAKEILQGTVRAGRELAASGKVSAETMAVVRQPILQDRKSWFLMGNLMWKTCIADGITPREFNEKGLVPRPDSIETFMLIMSMGFNPRGAGDTKAVIQFDFSGDVEGSCHFRIEAGRIEALPGVDQNPDLVIMTPFSIWLDIMAGRLDGQQAFMEQKYRVSGEISILMQLKQLFDKGAHPEDGHA